MVYQPAQCYSLINQKIFCFQQDERPEINPNDAQKGQILGPYLGKDKDEHRIEGYRENPRREDDNMDTGVKVDGDDNEAVQEHKAPLALGQIQEPNAMDNALDSDKSKVDAQQMPPVINEEVYVFILFLFVLS